MTFQAFIWEERFATGISLIDEQHQRLIALINRLGQVQLDAAAAGLPEAITAVQDYADYHFHSEEALWEQGGASAEALTAHHTVHTDFSGRVADLANDRTLPPQELARLLHDFLCSWLALHILGDDQEMASRIQRQPSLAHSESNGTIPPSRLRLPLPSDALLLRAVRRLYAALSAMNTQLRETNRDLDARVLERTHELSTTVQTLERARDQLAKANRELATAHARLIENERLASVGQLAAGVAHEINNPVGFVSSNLHTLGEYLEDIFSVLDAYAAAEPLIAPDAQAIAAVHTAKKTKDLAFARQDATALLAESRAGLQRIKQIVKDLQAFTGVDGDNWQSCNPLRSLESALNIVASQLARKTEVQHELEELPAIRCRPTQLAQVFVRLLLNAGQAIDGRGTITVRSGTHDEAVWIEVEDDGHGIADENQSRIFDPFYTTQAVGQGMGLGLFVAWNIVNQHGGHFELTSRSGVGSRFRVVLPRQPTDPLTPGASG